MQIEQRKVTDLIPYARNARTHSDEQVAQIAASIKEFGFNNPILVDGENGIIAGHGRLAAARKLGLDTVPVIELAHMSDTKKRAYILADNKLAMNAGWDFELLGVELEELKIDGIDLELTGFGDFHVDPLEEMPTLPSGDREPFQQMTFNLHDEQAEKVKEAIATSKQLGPFVDTENENSNGNAIARICEIFLMNNDNS